VGASWEGFVLEQIINHIQARPEECYFWSTYSGAELDLLVVRGRRRIGFEVKRTVSPKITPSMRQALKDLRLQGIDVIHAGEGTFPLDEKIRAVSLSRLLADVDVLG
jgi:predicted AAA+ superfamily ATPase